MKTIATSTDSKRC